LSHHALPSPEALPALAGDQRKANRQFFTRLRKKPPRDLDLQVAELHEEVFAQMDCLSCANCCKTISPVFTDRDIARIAKHLRVKPADFTEQYLHLDEEQDYVLNQAPCPFLGADNYCSIYEVRPKACRQYPHTDQPGFRKKLSLTLKNTEVCPAAFRIVERLREELS
jgi:uncharacterized protein